MCDLFVNMWPVLCCAAAERQEGVVYIVWALLFLPCMASAAVPALHFLCVESDIAGYTCALQLGNSSDVLHNATHTVIMFVCPQRSFWRAVTTLAFPVSFQGIPQCWQATSHGRTSSLLYVREKGGGDALHVWSLRLCL